MIRFKYILLFIGVFAFTSYLKAGEEATEHKDAVAKSGTSADAKARENADVKWSPVDSGEAKALTLDVTPGNRTFEEGTAEVDNPAEGHEWQNPVDTEPLAGYEGEVPAEADAKAYNPIFYGKFKAGDGEGGEGEGTLDWALKGEYEVEEPTAKIDGYIYGESSRKIENMQDLSEPANVVASGYIKFKARIEPDTINEDELYYKWSVTAGTLTDPEGEGEDYLEVKWDAPDGHKQSVTLTLEVKKAKNGAVICTETVDLQTIRPYTMRVKFIDDFWNEEQQIYENGGENTPEFDAKAEKMVPCAMSWPEGCKFKLMSQERKTTIRLMILPRKRQYESRPRPHTAE